MELRNLSNEELINKAHIEICSITSTPLELELIRRFEELCDQQAKMDEADDFLASINAEDFEAISSALADHNVENIKTLREKLERADKFYDLAREAAEAFTMLANLANETN